MPFTKITWRAENNYDKKAASDECQITDFGPSMTIQSMAEDADINVMMERFKITGQMPQDPRPLYYGDFTEIFDFRSAQEAVIAANHAFNELPAKLRARFNNDPQAYLDFCEDPENEEEMIRLGMATKRPDPLAKPPDKPQEGQTTPPPVPPPQGGT